MNVMLLLTYAYYYKHYSEVFLFLFHRIVVCLATSLSLGLLI